MTTKELINQYVSAHADNRWMDASELEALLTEFAEKLKEQMMKDAIDSEVKWCNYGYPDFPIEDLAVLDEIVLPKDKFQIGDKVKVIIIKE